MLLAVLLLSLFVVFPALCIYALCIASARADHRAAVIQAHLDGVCRDMQETPSTAAINKRISGKLMRQMR